MDVRTQIQSIIKDRALQQSAFAPKAGFTPCQLSAVLTCRRKLEAHELIRISAALGLSVDEIISYLQSKEYRRERR